MLKAPCVKVYAPRNTVAARAAETPEAGLTATAHSGSTVQNVDGDESQEKPSRLSRHLAFISEHGLSAARAKLDAEGPSASPDVNGVTKPSLATATPPLTPDGRRSPRGSDRESTLFSVGGIFHRQSRWTPGTRASGT